MYEIFECMPSFHFALFTLTYSSSTSYHLTLTLRPITKIGRSTRSTVSPLSRLLGHLIFGILSLRLQAYAINIACLTTLL